MFTRRRLAVGLPPAHTGIVDFHARIVVCNDAQDVAALKGEAEFIAGYQRIDQGIVGVQGTHVKGLMRDGILVDRRSEEKLDQADRVGHRRGDVVERPARDRLVVDFQDAIVHLKEIAGGSGAADDDARDVDRS